MVFVATGLAFLLGAVVCGLLLAHIIIHTNPDHIDDNDLH